MGSKSDRPLREPPSEGEPGFVEVLEKKVIKVLKNCFDPEIPVNIYELGLIYDVAVKPEGSVHVKMTLTSPMCPVAESLPPEVENKIKLLMDVTSATVEVVWDPPWEPSMMSEAAKLELNMM
jgi:FeS assembly SUF system protein